MKKIDIPIYNLSILTFTSFKDVKRYAEKTGAMQDDSLDNALHCAAACFGTLNYEDGAELFIAVDMDQAASTLDALESVTHECSHAAFWLCGHLGIEVVPMELNNEAYTYLQQFLFGEYVRKNKVLEMTFDNP